MLAHNICSHLGDKAGTQGSTLYGSKQCALAREVYAGLSGKVPFPAVRFELVQQPGQ